MLPLFVLMAAACSAPVGRSAPGPSTEPDGGEPPRPPQIVVSPTSVDFGDARPSDARSATLTIENAGEMTLRFGAGDEAPQIYGAAADEFSVTWPPAGLDSAGLAAGESLTVEVKFDASIAGRRAATLVIGSDDPVTPATEVQLAAHVRECVWVAEPPNADFGLLAPNDGHGTVALQLRNVSQDPEQVCTFSNFAVEYGTQGAPEFVFSMAPTINLNSGEAATLTINAVVGARTGDLSEATLAFDVEDATPVGQGIAMRAQVDRCTAASTAVVDFGSVSTCDTSGEQRTFEIGTGCNAQLTIAQIALEDSTGAFAITPPSRMTATPGNAVAVSVNFRPAFARTYVARVVFTVAGGPQYAVELRGDGADPIHVTESFVQPAELDVLYILDTSCSMADQQQQLANEYSALTQALTARGVNWRFGSVMASGSSTGYLGQFACQENCSGTFSFGCPSCTGSAPFLELTRAALSEAAIRASNGFLRPNAALAILIMSDLGDTGSGTAASYATDLLASKGPSRENYVFFAAEVPTSRTPPTGACSYDSNFNGTLPMNVAESMGGVAEDICSSGSAVRSFLADARRVLLLEGKPDITKTPVLTVLINGTALPEAAGTTTNWTYDVTKNRLTIDPSVQMAVGATVDISYIPRCQ